MRLRISQSTGGTKYFIVVGITSTTITLYGGTDYTLNNETISSPVFSSAKVPFGFPVNPSKWTVELKSTSTVSQGTASADTWYNLGSLSIVIPIGLWRVNYQAAINCSRNPVTDIDQFTTLSTGSNTESDADFTTSTYLRGASADLDILTVVNREKIIALTSKTTYYLNSLTKIANTNININSDRSPTIIRAVCAYL